jgi:hypothetical protein
MTQLTPLTNEPSQLDDESSLRNEQLLLVTSLVAALVLSSIVILPRIPVKVFFGYSNIEGWLAFAGFVVVGTGLTLLLQVADVSRRYAQRTSISTRVLSLLPAVLGAFVAGFAVWSLAFGCEALLDSFVFDQPRFYRGYNASGNIVVFRGLFPAFIGGGARAGFVFSRLLTAPMKSPWPTLVDLYYAFFGACLGAFIAALIWIPWGLILLILTMG